MRTSPASGAVPEPPRVTVAPPGSRWAGSGPASTEGVSSISPVPGFMASWDSRLPAPVGVAKGLKSLCGPGLSALPQEAGPPTFSGTSRRLLDAKRTLPPLLARLLISVAFASVVSKDELGKHGLCLLPICDRALCLVPLVQSALLAIEQLTYIVTSKRRKHRAAIGGCIQCGMVKADPSLSLRTGSPRLA